MKRITTVLGGLFLAAFVLYHFYVTGSVLISVIAR